MNTAKSSAQSPSASPTIKNNDAFQREVESALMETATKVLRVSVREAVRAGLHHALQVVPPSVPPSKQAGDKLNGICRPSPGGRCAAVWDELDNRYKLGQLSTVADMRTVASEKGWNKHNTEIEFYRWRKYNQARFLAAKERRSSKVDRRVH